MPNALRLDDLAILLRKFADERDWAKFHTPRNLAISLAVELGELLEHFQWQSDLGSPALEETDTGHQGIAAELADVLIYLVRLADVLNIDLSSAVQAKVASNRSRYPAVEVRGSATKRP